MFCQTTHYRLLLTTMKTATHRDNGKCDRVVWIKTKKKIKVWLKPCLLACTMCSVCVGVRAGTITGTVKSATIVYWELKEAVIRYFIPAWKLLRRNLCFTKDVPSLHKRQPWAADWITPSLEISYPSEEWCSDLTGRCVDPTRTRQSKQGLRGGGG